MTNTQVHPSDTTGGATSSSATTVRFSSGTNIAAGAWLLVAPFALGYSGTGAAVANDIIVGLVVLTLGAVSAVAGNKVAASR